MQTFEIIDLVQQQRKLETPYLEFLRIPSLSMGLYFLPASAVDTQQPHTEDETYYIVSGHASMFVNGEIQPVGAGSIIFVAAGAEHRFQAISEDLTVLVFFAPAEYTLTQTHTEVQV